MNKTLLLTLLLGGLSAPLFAQSTPAAQGAGAIRPKGTGKISGTILEASTRKPVPFASIALLDPSTGKPVDGTSADEKGQFSIRGIGSGTYSISISFLGYKTLEKTSVALTEKNNDVQLGTLELAAEATQLKEVTVTGQRALIEERVDRTVYNAENDQTTRGGDATDVLKRVPMLSVDLDGNVSLRGSSNIRVLINNKPSTIAANSVADALKQIPADQIKSVEVITSPSAKYDAEGSGGIINIITKKNALQGATLNVDASAGTRGSNLGLNGSYRKGKMGFSLGGFGRAGYNIVGNYHNTQQTNQILTLQQADSRTQMLMGRYTLGWDYDINEHNSLNASVQYGLFNLNNYQDRLLTQTLENNTLVGSSLRSTNLADLSGTVDLSLNYTHTTAVPQREFSILTLYSRNNRNNDFRNDILDADELITSRLKNENTSSNQEMTVQVDYQTPIGDKQMLELGGKNIMRQVNSRYAYFTAAGSTGAYLPATSSSLSNAFDYTQNVTAGYVSYTLNFLKNYSLKAGTRYEYTTIDASFQADETVAIPSYGVLVPSVNFSRKLANGNMVKVAYNRRIQRPSLQFLNPNVQAANPYSITQGNATLQPEYTNNYELSYSTFWKKMMLNMSSFVRTTNGSIQPVRSSIQQDTVVYTTYANIGRENAYGLSLFTNVNLSNKLTLSGGTDAYYAVLTNNVADPLYSAKNQGWVVNGRVFGNYSLKNDWGLQAFAFYRGNQVQLQGFQSGFGIYSLSVRKDFDEKRGSFGLGAENFFSPTMQMRTEVNSPLVNQSSTNVLHNMSFKLNFSYRIGKLGGNPQPKRRKTVTNDDLKDGGDNSGGGSMQGGSVAPAPSGPAARPAVGLTPEAKPTGTSGTQPGTPTPNPAAPAAAPSDSTQRPVESLANGRWSGQLGTQEIVLELQQAGTTLTGTFSTPTGKTPLSAGTVTGSTFTFSLTTNGSTVVYEGQAQGNQLTLSVRSGATALTGALTRQQ